MRMLLALLPLLGLVAAQQNGGQNHGGVNNGMPNHGGVNNGMPNHGKGGFFQGNGKSSSTVAPWANPAQQAGAQAVPFGGSIGGSQSSTKSPGGAAIGNPQLPVVGGANANPNNPGGSSGGMAGFGAHDYYLGAGGPDVMSPQGAAPNPAGGRNTNQNSGEQTNGFFGGGADGGGGYDMGPGLIAGGGFDSKDMEKTKANEVVNAGTAASTIVGVVIAVLIVIGIFALVAVFLVRQRRQSRVVIGSV